MNKIIILIGLLSLVLVGCNSSFQDCNTKCNSVYIEDYTTKEICQNEMDQLVRVLSKNPNVTIHEYEYDKTNWESLKSRCFSECKGVQ